MDDHPIHDDSMQEIVESFVVEATEIYDGLESDLLQLEQTPEDQELIDEIFRDVHTVKGTAGFLSLDQLSTLAHRFEEVLDDMRDGEIDFDPAMTDVMLCAFDHMKVLTQQVIDRDLQQLELGGLIEALKAISEGTFDADEISLPDPDAAPAPGASSAGGDQKETTSAEADDSASSEEASEADAEGDAVSAPKDDGDDSTEETDPTDDHPIHDDSMQEIVESFVVEATEIYDGLESDLLQLERTPDDQELVDGIFRDVHTVKGTAGFLSLDQLSTLAHRFEEVLDDMRDGEIDFDPAMTDVMLCAFDHMKVLTQQVIDRDLQQLELEGLIEALEAISEGTFDADEISLPDPDAAPGASSAGGDQKETTSAEADDSASSEEASEADAEDDGNDSTEETDASGSSTSTSGSSSGSSGSGGKAPDTIRVEVSRLNQLMDLVGELVLGRNRLLQLISDVDVDRVSASRTDDAEIDRLENLIGELEEASDKIDFTTSELQSAIMRTRMVQIGQVFGKFPRVVRDLSREFDKKINLVVEGEDTELDKSLVEEIDDPLLHLVRNAVDHGIESPEEREAKGKDPQGEIRLSASHAGNHIVIEVEDDGAGLDPDDLREKAVDRGVMTETEAQDLTDTEAHQLIFRPGFTTTEEASQVSGRGVGMDVVKTNLSELNGTIDIDSTLGEGTRFQLKLPLTLAILESMLVRSGAETFAIPLYAVSEVVRLEADMLESIQGGEVIHHRDRVVPIIRLGEALDVQVPNAGGARADRGDEPEDEYAVIVNVAHRRVALVVDEPIAQEEVVIKSLGDYLKAVPGIAGSTILGNGQVIMVLDVGELIQIEEPGGGAYSGENGAGADLDADVSPAETA